MVSGIFKGKRKCEESEGVSAGGEGTTTRIAEKRKMGVAPKVVNC